MKRLIFGSIIFIFLLAGVVNAQELTLSLDEALLIALRQNRDILLKAEDVNKAKEKIAEARAGLYPALNFTGTWSDTRGYYAEDLSSTTTQTTLKQYLYKGGKVINTIKYNGYSFEVSEALLDKARFETVLSVKKAFYALLLAEELAKLNKGILGNSQGHLDVLRIRYSEGQASESDVLKVESALSSVQQAHEASLNQVESGLVLLKNLLYLDEEVKINTRGGFSYEYKEIAYDEAFLKAMKSRPEIRQYEAQLEANKKSIELAKADTRPNIYASWDYYSRSHAAAATQKGWNDYNILGLTFSWPVFDGWAARAKLQQAMVDLKETQLTKEKTVKDIASELKNAYIELKNAILNIKTAEDQIVVSEDLLEVAETRYKEGQASTLDLDDAKLAYQVSLFNRTQAIYDYIVAKAKFDKATGGQI